MNLVTKWKLFEPQREKPLQGANPEINPLYKKKIKVTKSSNLQNLCS
jgi:hypothetical protein